MAELCECPFCGDEAFCGETDELFYIECDWCHICTPLFYNKDKAIEAWNRRTKIETNIYDKEETYPNCTVQVLTNTVTGETSVGWWKNPPSGIDFDYGAED